MQTTHQYDRLGRLSNVSDADSLAGTSTPQVAAKSLTFGYDLADNLTQISRAAGPTTSLAYDRADRVVFILHDLATDIVHNYGYDNASRIVDFNTTNVSTPTIARDFSYDDAGRLTSQGGGFHLEFYEYDDNGNRVLRGSYNHTSPIHTIGLANRLTNDGTFTFTYDGEGNIVTRTQISTVPANDKFTEYVWDHRNRLTRVTFKNESSVVTQTIEYTYDSEGRRVRRVHDPDGAGTAGPASEFFVYDGDELSMTFGNAQELTHRYLYGPLTDQVLVDEVFNAGAGGQRVSDEVLWLLADHQNTIRDIVDENGTLRKHMGYTPFGRVTGQVYWDASGAEISDPATHAQAIDQLFYFTGREWDDDAKLQNNRARWYDPSTGRFLNEDPIFAPNLYPYADNDPINKLDPTGLRAIKPTESLLGFGTGTGNPLAFDPSLASISLTRPRASATLNQTIPANQAQVGLYTAEVGRYRAEVDTLRARLATTRQSLANRSWYEVFDTAADRQQIGTLNDRLATAYGHLRVAQDNIRNAQRGAPIDVYHDTQYVSVGSALGSGLATGGKAVSNAGASSLTLGFYDGPFGVTQQDIYNGYNASRAIAGLSTDILVGVGTGGLATFAKAGSALRVAGKTALTFDTASNVVGVGRGALDVYQSGLTPGTSLQIVGGALGFGGNLAAGGRALGEIAADAGRVRVSFDPATLSAGGLGGVKFSLASSGARVFDLPLFPRGRAVELDARVLAEGRGGLPFNTEVIDRRPAVSVTSIDLGARTYQNSSSLVSRIVSKASRLAGYSGHPQLRVAVPNDVVPTAAQVEALRTARDQLKSMGVGLKIIPVN